MVGRIVRMDRLDAVDDLGDMARQFPRRHLPLAAKDDQPAAHARDYGDLDRGHRARDETEPEVLDEDEQQRGQRLTAEQQRLGEGVRREAAERLDLVLDHAGDLARLHLRHAGLPETQDAVDELIPDPPEQAFAQEALLGVDDVLEEAVDDDEREKGQAERQQHRQPFQRNAVRKLDRAVERNLQRQGHEGLRGAGPGEALALQGTVHDLLGQVECQVVGDHRDDDDEHHRELFAARVHPDVTKDVRFHRARLADTHDCRPARPAHRSVLSPVCAAFDRNGAPCLLAAPMAFTL